MKFNAAAQSMQGFWLWAMGWENIIVKILANL